MSQSLECRCWSLLGGWSWFLSHDMTRCWPSCLLFWAEGLKAICFSSFEAFVPNAPVHKNTSGQNVTISISFSLHSYLFFLIDSWWLYDPLILLEQLYARRLKNLITFNNVLCFGELYSEIPLALIFNLPLILVVDITANFPWQALKMRYGLNTMTDITYQIQKNAMLNMF